MSHITTVKHIAAPIETVFAVATDLEHAADHVRGIKKIELLTPTPVGVGARWRETRRMLGREQTETLQMVAFDPPHSYTIACESCGCSFETVFRLASIRDGTDVTLDVRIEPQSFFAKLMSPITNTMFTSFMRQCMDDDLEDIKQTAESRAAEQPAS